MINQLPKPESNRTGWPWTQETSPTVYDNNFSWPKITIVTPSYNQGAFLEETIRSILLQNYPNLEYIIIDGGSTDNSVEIIKKYAPWITFWVSEKDNGQSDAINKGLNKASGDILNWINSDDYLLPKALYHVGSFDWQPNTGALAGIGQKVDTHKEIIYTPPYYEPITAKELTNWTEGRNFMQPSCFFSRQAWDSCGPINEELYFCMDVELWFKIAHSFNFERISVILSQAYEHETAKTTADRDAMFIETYIMFAQQGFLQESKDHIHKYIKQVKRNTIAQNRSFTQKAYKHFSRNVKKVISFIL